MVISTKRPNFALANARRHLQSTCKSHRGVEQLVARQAHNLEVACSSPAPATKKRRKVLLFSTFFSLYIQTLCRNGGMVDTRDLKSLGHCARAGSSPASGTLEVFARKTIEYNRLNISQLRNSLVFLFLCLYPLFVHHVHTMYTKRGHLIHLFQLMIHLI